MENKMIPKQREENTVKVRCNEIEIIVSSSTECLDKVHLTAHEIAQEVFAGSLYAEKLQERIGKVGIR